MDVRAAGEIGCAHCQTIGATAACSICALLVCAPCSLDWGTCNEPTGREVRLGLTARVRDIDPLGRYALVSHWRQPLRLFDLRRLRWVDGVTLPGALHSRSRWFPPRLTSDGRVFHAEVEAFGPFRGFWSLHLASRERVWIDGMHAVGPRDARPTAVSAKGDWFYYFSDAHLVTVVEPDMRASTYEPLPTHPLHAVAIDAPRRLLASGSWGEVALHRIEDFGLVPVSYALTAAKGKVVWLGHAGAWLAILVESPDAPADVYLEVRPLDHAHAIGPAMYRARICLAHHFHGATMSADGRFVAIAAGVSIVMVALETGETTVLDGHTDRINAIRFAADDHRLISADTDNRLIIRPRSEIGAQLRPLDLR